MLKSSETYGYTNSTWGDLLTNYDGTTISYDASGNPTNWKNASNLYWTGNRLTYATAESNGGPYTAMQYAYDANGIRTSKNYQRHVIGASYIDYYTVDGTKILSEKRIGGTNNTTQRTIYYVYDANGAVIGMEYNGTKYWYDKNLLGDVVGIRNASGTLVAQYVYDAWGNHRQITDGSGNDVSDNPNHIANINPFRFRAYYYDTETGWYYLNARYYDPNVGRFLSPDTILGANGGLLGYNLYAYCNNNPVMFADPSGQSLILTGIAAKVATALGVLVTPIIVKAAADGLKIATDLVNSGVEAVADLFSSSDNKPDNITVTPAPTIEDIEHNILTFEERRPFHTFFPDTPSNKLGIIFDDEVPDVKYPGDDGSIPPGDDYEWHGKLPIGGDKGAWVNPITGEQWHPDLNHAPPKGPHWDYEDRNGNWWSVFKDGRIIPIKK